jgi:hypothetical protein
MSEVDSFNIGSEESLHIVTPITNQIISKINHHNSDNGRTSSRVFHSKYCNVLVSHKSGKLSINPEF